MTRERSPALHVREVLTEASCGKRRSPPLLPKREHKEGRGFPAPSRSTFSFQNRIRSEISLDFVLSCWRILRVAQIP